MPKKLAAQGPSQINSNLRARNPSYEREDRTLLTVRTRHTAFAASIGVKCPPYTLRYFQTLRVRLYQSRPRASPSIACVAPLLGPGLSRSQP